MNTNINHSVTYLKVSTEAWELLEDTLRMDAQSGSFDMSLRQEIEDALSQVEKIEATGESPDIVVAVDFAIDQIEQWNRSSVTGLIGSAFEALVNASARNGGMAEKRVNLFGRLGHGLAATERVLLTLHVFWNVKVVTQGDGMIVVQHPYKMGNSELSYALFSLSDNGGEVNVERINHSEEMRSIPSSSSKYLLTAETMAWRIWCAMTGEETDWAENNIPSALPDKIKPMPLGM